MPLAFENSSFFYQGTSKHVETYVETSRNTFFSSHLLTYFLAHVFSVLFNPLPLDELIFYSSCMLCYIDFNAEQNCQRKSGHPLETAPRLEINCLEHASRLHAVATVLVSCCNFIRYFVPEVFLTFSALPSQAVLWRQRICTQWWNVMPQILRTWNKMEPPCSEGGTSSMMFLSSFRSGSYPRSAEKSRLCHLTQSIQPYHCLSPYLLQYIAIL